MASDISPELLRHLAQLSPNEQLALLRELQGRPAAATDQPEHSILELEGLGKEIWQGIDAQQYVDRERESWNG